jgi:pimeloyl-ACP methyl ester carboxylesterase
MRRVIVPRPPTPHAYVTHSLHAVRQCRDLAAGLDAAATKVTCPTLVLVGDRDPVVPAESTVTWTSAHLRADLRRLPEGWHALFTDGTATDAAIDAVASFLIGL